MRGVSQFGGFVDLGGKKLAVSGRTLRHIFEIQDYLHSLIENPIDELRRLCDKNESLKSKAFVAGWVKTCRHLWLGRKSELEAKFLASPEGKVFSLWQSVRDNGVSYDFVVDQISAVEAKIELWMALSRGLATASGNDETSAFSELRKRIGVAGEKISLDGAIAWLISERGWKLDDILDMTLTTLRQVRMSAAELDDGIAQELVAETHPGLEMKKEEHRRIYRRVAEAILEGKRIDDWSDKDDRTKWPLMELDLDGKKHHVLECKKCIAAGKDSKHVRLRKFQQNFALQGNQTRYVMKCQICGQEYGRGSVKIEYAVTQWNKINRPDDVDED